MILKALTLENFKGIREPVRIEFAPLTLLFGRNNAGKSTIVQALMYAREVLERNNCDAGRTVLGGDVVDLGGFRSLVHGHDLTRSIRMRFELDRVELHNYIEASCEDDLYDPAWLEYEEEDDKHGRIIYPALDELTQTLGELWVEIEVSWSSRLRAPTVTRYEVGTPGATLAKIILDEKGQAGILATESSYHFALDVDDLGADIVARYELACEVWLDSPEDQYMVSGLELPFPENFVPGEIAFAPFRYAHLPAARQRVVLLPRPASARCNDCAVRKSGVVYVRLRCPADRHRRPARTPGPVRAAARTDRPALSAGAHRDPGRLCGQRSQIPALLDRLIALKAQRPERFFPILGNHDLALLRTLGWPGGQPDPDWYGRWAGRYWKRGEGTPLVYGDRA